MSKSNYYSVRRNCINVVGLLNTRAQIYNTVLLDYEKHYLRLQIGAEAAMDS